MLHLLQRICLYLCTTKSRLLLIQVTRMWLPLLVTSYLLHFMQTIFLQEHTFAIILWALQQLGYMQTYPPSCHLGKICRFSCKLNLKAFPPIPSCWENTSLISTGGTCPPPTIPHCLQNVKWPPGAPKCFWPHQSTSLNYQSVLQLINEQIV